MKCEKTGKIVTERNVPIVLTISSQIGRRVEKLIVEFIHNVDG